EFAAPDVIDDHVNVTVLFPDLLGQGLHLGGVKMVDCGRNASPTEACDQFGSLLDRLGTVVVRPNSGSTAAATCAYDCCASFAQRSSHATPSTSGRAGNDRHATAQCISNW